MLHWNDGAVVSRELLLEMLTSSALLPLRMLFSLITGAVDFITVETQVSWAAVVRKVYDSVKLVRAG